MRFQVPQFIETENKVVGPFTIKQFIWLAAGGALIFLLFYTVKNLTLLVALALPIAIVSIALAFVKLNGIPLPKFIYMAVYFLFKPKRYTFNKEDELPNLPGDINNPQ
jgi:hypothetical protein